MVVIVGLGDLHGRLVAAALRGCGLAATAAPPPTDDALALGRTLMPRGHPCSVYYLAGAMALYARDARDAPRFVAPGDRCGAYATDLARALRRSGAERATVCAPTPEGGLSGLAAALGVAPRPAADALRDALSAADALTAVGAKLRARGCHFGAVADLIEPVARGVIEALESRGDTVDAIRSRARALKTWRRCDTPPLRVRVTGELLPTVCADDPGARLVRWMEAHGAEVETPRACEWAIYHAWRAGACEDTAAAARASLRDAWARHAAATGHALAPLVDVTAWVAEASRWLPVSLSAGAGFTEIATYLDVARADRADLVVSLKPFASIVSSAVSDAVLQALARERGVAFVALEVNGDGHAQMRARLQVAMDFARRPCRSRSGVRP